MPYTTNPHISKVRMDAVNLVKYRGWSMRKVAEKFGVEPSTISRWCKLPMATGWCRLETRSSRPNTSPKALSKEVVEAIIKKRNGRRRCGQHIYQELKREGVFVSLPSVQRTLDRLGLLKKRSVWKRPHDATPRPVAVHSGALIQVDTVHIMDPFGTKIYIYTLIDLFSRFAYAEVTERISANRSAMFINRAQKAAPFRFEMIQTDHGPEFSTWFTHALQTNKVSHRHSRVRRANDNAHIERFNRTIQEECFDRTACTIPNFKKALKEYLSYYNNERIHMGINYQTPMEVLRRS
jgi:transposase InsO family protein